MLNKSIFLKQKIRRIQPYSLLTDCSLCDILRCSSLVSTGCGLFRASLQKQEDLPWRFIRSPSGDQPWAAPRRVRTTSSPLPGKKRHFKVKTMKSSVDALRSSSVQSVEKELRTQDAWQGGESWVECSGLWPRRVECSLRAGLFYSSRTRPATIFIFGYHASDKSATPPQTARAPCPQRPHFQ